MKPLPGALFFILMTSWLAFAGPDVTLEAPVSDLEQAFRDELGFAARKAFELRGVNFSPLKKINDSYRLTAEAIRVLAERGDVQKAVPLLQEATRKFDGNRLAHLLTGYAFEKLGQTEEAARAYSSFYRNSLTLIPVERRLISPSALQTFRDYVEARFEEWDLRLPQTKVSIGLQKVRSVLMLEESATGQLVNMALPFLMIVGFLLLMLTRMAQIEIPPATSYFLTRFYLLIVTAYLIWSAHFFLGLPFLISLKTEMFLLFGAGTFLILAFYAGSRFLADRREMKMEGTKRCPSCKKIILRVSAQCPVCGSKAIE